MTEAGRPLAGKTVVVTRPRHQADSLAGPLEALGAAVLLVPTIRIVPRPLDDEIRSVVAALDGYDLVVFTSVNGVDVFFQYLDELGIGRVALTGATVAAIGPATASALEVRGVSCDVVPDDYVAEGLLEALERRAVAPSGARVLIPRARKARAILPDTLRQKGAVVDVLPVYDTVAARSLGVRPEQIERADYITFTSSSTVRQFAALMEPSARGRSLASRLSSARLCSIGPVTNETLRGLGLPVAVQASEFTTAGLAAAIAAAACGLA